MLTSQGWWFFIVACSLTTIGLFDRQPLLALLGLTLLLWFLAEWFLFALRVHLALPTCRLEREVRDDRGTVASLWAGHRFEVHVRLCLGHRLDLPFVRVLDSVPPGVELTGQAEKQAVLASDQALTLAYHIRSGAPGRIRFEGLTIELADFQGFFYHATFLTAPQEYRVLPAMAGARGQRPTMKRHNLLPSPGVHRHLRPGSGSELLDLRDYMPGDPPKTIAWKVSARRDRLITKEFESEVPLRCTLFVDTSQSVRVGPPGQNPLVQLVDITAAVAQAAVGARDLIGLCLFEDQGLTASVRPARGARHLATLLGLLADAAALAPAIGQASVPVLMPLAYALAQEIYPRRIGSEINRVPFLMPWLWPAAPEIARRPFRLRGLAGWLIAALAFVPFAILVLLGWMYRDLFLLFLPLPEQVLSVIGVLCVLVLGAVYYAVLRLAGRLVGSLFSRQRRRNNRLRKKLAALLSERYGLLPGGLGRLLEDDESFSLHLQRFLADHRVPAPLSL